MPIKKLKKEDTLAGSLSKYAKNVKGKIPFKKIREMAWEKAVCEKERKRKKDYDSLEHALYNTVSVKGKKAWQKLIEERDR